MLKLQELGFTNAFALLGGLSAWQLAKLPTEQLPPPEQAPEATPAPAPKP